ncbi:MAG: hypothetical protein RLZZ96_1147 [Bacteroidota bacterium]|jgi:hypothetical protein
MYSLEAFFNAEVFKVMTFPIVYALSPLSLLSPSSVFSLMITEYLYPLFVLSIF